MACIRAAQLAAPIVAAPVVARSANLVTSPYFAQAPFISRYSAPLIYNAQYAVAPAPIVQQAAPIVAASPVVAAAAPVVAAAKLVEAEEVDAHPQYSYR